MSFRVFRWLALGICMMGALLLYKGVNHAPAIQMTCYCPPESPREYPPAGHGAADENAAAHGGDAERAAGGQQ